MIFNGKWDNPKVVIYLQAGKALDMLDFSLNQAIKNSGLDEKDYDLFVICWRTSPEVYDYLRKKNIKYIDMEYEPDKDFVWNLYKGWNLGYEIGYQHADYVVPIATDHAFYKNWLKNLFLEARPNRIVNCKLIESGALPTVHTAIDLGLTTEGQFKQEEFDKICKKIYKDELATDEKKYGHVFDAMPFICPKDVWERFGPMSPYVMKDGTTGDTDFFNRCRAGGVEIVKALNSISYHCGGIETYRNESFIGKLKIKISANLPDSVKKVLRKYIKRRLSIGIIGLGVVGEAMRCGFEEKQGHRVRVVGHDKKYKTSIENVFNNSDLIFITVSTPTGPDGACDVSAVESVCRDLNKLAKKMSIKKDVVIKSTVEPGTTDRLAKELKNLRFAFNPEFLKERSAFSDFVNQDICVIGTKHNDLYRKIVYIYGNLAKEFIRTTPLNAEFLKYFLNVFNSTRIIFANLFYDLVSKMGGNYKEVKSMAVKRHNMIDYYLDCGEGMRGFGGKCLPKDTLAIQAFAKKMGVNYAFLEGLLADNERLNREYPQRPEFMDNGKSL